jgi:hypothetical protein
LGPTAKDAVAVAPEGQTSLIESKREDEAVLKVDRLKQHFTRLETPSLADASISERYDLQEYICNSPESAGAW